MSFKKQQSLDIEVYETSANGNQLTRIELNEYHEASVIIQLKPETKFQTITGFGGSFTQASASLLNRLGTANRKNILEAYFGESRTAMIPIDGPAIQTIIIPKQQYYV